MVGKILHGVSPVGCPRPTPAAGQTGRRGCRQGQGDRLPRDRGAWEAGEDPTAHVLSRHQAVIRPAGTPRPPVDDALDGRSPGLRVISRFRLPGARSSGIRETGLAAYSCGGSRGIGIGFMGRTPHLIPSCLRHICSRKQAGTIELPNGRSERIRTSDPLVPNEVRYQAAPHSDTTRSGRYIPPFPGLQGRGGQGPRSCVGPAIWLCSGAFRGPRAHLRENGPPAMLGRRQVVRQRILIPSFGGSNPPAPAKQSGSNRLFSCSAKTRRRSGLCGVASAFGA
jgi:hypothetical protein